MGHFVRAYRDIHSGRATICPKTKESFRVHIFARPTTSIVAGSLHVGVPCDHVRSISGRLYARRRLGVYFRGPSVVAYGRRVTYFRVHRSFVVG